jgi:hypothetical protein
MTTDILPPGVKLSDLAYPRHHYDVPLEQRDTVTHTLTLDYVESFGWCVRTLHIRNPGRRARAGATERTYASRVSDGRPVRIGIGPHVKRTIHVYVRRSRLDALKRLVDLHEQGAVDANTIRDRISSRRAQSALRRRDTWF